MLNNISWTDYIAIVSLLFLVYYSFIGIKFYSYELRQLLSGKIKLPVRFSPSKIGVNEDEESILQAKETKTELFISDKKYIPSVQEIDDSFQQAEKLSIKLKDAISDAASKNYNKEEFAFLLQLTLKEYPILKGSGFQVAINNLVVSECEKYGFISLSDEELVMLWNDVVC